MAWLLSSINSINMASSIPFGMIISGTVTRIYVLTICSNWFLLSNKIHHEWTWLHVKAVLPPSNETQIKILFSFSITRIFTITVTKIMDKHCHCGLKNMIILETVYQSCLNGLPICWTILFICLKGLPIHSNQLPIHSAVNFIHPLIYSFVWTVNNVYQSVRIIYSSVGIVSQIVQMLCWLFVNH